MSETTLTHPGPHQSLLRSSDILTNLIVTLLMPMFLAAAGGDLNYARMAATETVQTYCAGTLTGLIIVAKIVAFGLAALGSLSLSMEDDLPIETVLRLHADATASDRAEHRNHRLLKQTQTQTPLRRAARPTPPPVPADDPDPGPDEATLFAAVAETRKRTADHLARTSAPAPSTQAAPVPPSIAPAEPTTPVPTTPVPATPVTATQVPATQVQTAPVATHHPPAAKTPAPRPQAQSDAKTQDEAIWAASMARIAAETAASLPNLPSSQRHAAKLWVEVLNDVANDVLTNPSPPPPKPG